MIKRSLSKLLAHTAFCQRVVILNHNIMFLTVNQRNFASSKVQSSINSSHAESDYTYAQYLEDAKDPKQISHSEEKPQYKLIVTDNAVKVKLKIYKHFRKSNNSQQRIKAKNTLRFLLIVVVARDFSIISKWLKTDQRMNCKHLEKLILFRIFEKDGT